jgi:hypothetical protein
MKMLIKIFIALILLLIVVFFFFRHSSKDEKGDIHREYPLDFPAIDEELFDFNGKG